MACRPRKTQTVESLMFILAGVVQLHCAAGLSVAMTGGSVTRVQWPQSVSDTVAVGPMAVATGDVVVVAARGGGTAEVRPERGPGPCAIWSLALRAGHRDHASPSEELSRLHCDVPFTDVVSMVSSGAGVWMGTDKGVLTLVGRELKSVRPRALKLPITPPVYSDFTYDGVQGLSVDADGWVWVLPRWLWPAICVFHSDAADREPKVYRVTDVRAEAVVGSLSGPGVWVVAWKGHGKAFFRLTPDLLPVHADPDTPWFRVVRGKPLLQQAPALDLSGIRVGAWGDALWITGEAGNAVHILVCENNALKEQRGFEQFLGKRRVTDIAFDKVGTVYFATDGAGVIVFDGQQWQPHPMNNDLPVVAGTNRKPVSHVLPLSDGRVAVCTGEYLLIWGEEERKEQP